MCRLPEAPCNMMLLLYPFVLRYTLTSVLIVHRYMWWPRVRTRPFVIQCCPFFFVFKRVFAKFTPLFPSWYPKEDQCRPWQRPPCLFAACPSGCAHRAFRQPWPAPHRHRLWHSHQHLPCQAARARQWCLNDWVDGHDEDSHAAWGAVQVVHPLCTCVPVLPACWYPWALCSLRATGSLAELAWCTDMQFFSWPAIQA